MSEGLTPSFALDFMPCGLFVDFLAWKYEDNWTASEDSRKSLLAFCSKIDAVFRLLGVSSSTLCASFHCVSDLMMPPPTTDTAHARIADNLRRTVELTELGLALRQAVLQQRDPCWTSMAQVMHEIRLAKEQAWASEPILVNALSDLIADFNRRGVSYALAGGWACSALVEPRQRRISISSFFLNSRHANRCSYSFPLCSIPP